MGGEWGGGGFGQCFLAPVGPDAVFAQNFYRALQLQNAFSMLQDMP